MKILKDGVPRVRIQKIIKKHFIFVICFHGHFCLFENYNDQKEKTL